MGAVRIAIRAIAREVIADALLVFAMTCVFALLACVALLIWTAWTGAPPAAVAAWLSWQWP